MNVTLMISPYLGNYLNELEQIIKKLGMVMKTILFFFILIIIFSCDSKDTKQDSNRIEIGRGVITTITDGYDVREVNLWSSTTSNREKTGAMKNGEEVIILSEDTPYYLIKSANGDGRKGYCMKEFVILKK